MSAIPQLLAQLMGQVPQPSQFGRGQLPPSPPYYIPPAGGRFTNAPFQSGPEALIPDEVDVWGRPMSFPNNLPPSLGGSPPVEAPPMPNLPPSYATPGTGELPSPPIPAMGTMGPELQAFGMMPKPIGPRQMPQGPAPIPANAQRAAVAGGPVSNTYSPTDVPEWDQMVRDARADDDDINRLLTIRLNNPTDAQTPEGLAALRSLTLRNNPQYKNALAANIGRREADLQKELPPIPMHIKGAGEFGHSLDIARILKSKKKRRTRRQDAFAARRAGQTLEGYRASRDMQQRILDDPNYMTLAMGGTLEGQAALQQATAATDPKVMAADMMKSWMVSRAEAGTPTTAEEYSEAQNAINSTLGINQAVAGGVPPLPAAPGAPPTPNLVQRAVPHLQNLSGLIDRTSQNVFGGKPIQGLAGLFVEKGNVVGENVTKGSLQQILDEASIGNQNAMRILQRLRRQGHVDRHGLRKEVDAVLSAEERFATPTGPRRQRADGGDILDKAAGFVRDQVMGGVSARR